MAMRIGINGFGRIGRYLVRLMADNAELPVVAINARADNASLAHLFKYDSVHGTFKGTVGHDDNGIIVNGHHIAVTRFKAGEWTWKELGVNLVVETTGTIKKRAGLAEHLARGAKKVIMSAPVPDADTTIVMGVNDNVYDPAKHDVISAASCTTNCLAPVAKALNDAFGIERGLMTTIHSYTMSQRILDGSQKDIRRARAAGMSMIPTTTGAAKAVALVIPELKGKLDGTAVRVPTPNVSMIDLVCDTSKDVSIEAINAVLKAAANDNLGYSDEPLVSIDYNGDTHGGVVDGLSTFVIGARMLKVLAWYDNEAGFTNQLLRLIGLVGNKL
ncbi:MAG: type I glyceraldehyde-3-phosphate dehydrogenase [Bilophila sp.]